MIILKDVDGRLRIMDDSGTIGTLGSFHGPEDTIELKTVFPNQMVPEGKEMLIAFIEHSPHGWAGLFFKPGLMEQNTTIDVSRYAKEGELRFWICSSNDVQVGIRSGNIPPGKERSKLWLCQENLANLDGRWERVCIKLKRFAALDSRLRFSEMQIMMMAAVSNPKASDEYILLDDIAWFLSSDSRQSPRQSVPLSIDLGVKDFLASNLIGGSCKLSTADNQLELSFSRPSSGVSSTVLNLKEGSVSFEWDIHGLGHGYQFVLPYGDARYPGVLENLAKKLRKWADEKMTYYRPKPQTSPLPMETQASLKIAANRLLELQATYPTVKHDPKNDVIWENEGADTVLRLRASASKELKLAVVGRIVSVESIDVPKADEVASSEWCDQDSKLSPFSAFFSFPPNVYEEAVAQAKKGQLLRFEMSPSKGGFETRIPLCRKQNQFQYVIVVQDEFNRSNVCLLNDMYAFVSPK